MAAPRCGGYDLDQEMFRRSVLAKLDALLSLAESLHGQTCTAPDFEQESGPEDHDENDARRLDARMHGESDEDFARRIGQATRKRPPEGGR